MPERIVYAIRRLGAAVDDATFDMAWACLLLPIGFWYLVPEWANSRFPSISRDMMMLAPLWAWGAWMIGISATIIVGAMWKMRAVLATAYVLAIMNWFGLGWVFLMRAGHPPIFGMMIPSLVLFSFIRLFQVADSELQ